MFAYCTEVLHLSEAAAYLRIAVARALRSFPQLLVALAGGEIHLRSIALLAPHLSHDNCTFVLGRAKHATRRQVEELIAELAPKPDVPPRIRKLPPKKPAPAVAPASPAAPVQAPPPRSKLPVPPRALAPERYKVQFTASRELRDKLEKLIALIPEAGLADAIEAAVTEKLERLEAKRSARTRRPRKRLEQADTSSRSRYVPAAVKRRVHERDKGRCTFVSASGRRCAELHRLELHHVVPFARGGGHGPDNLRLMCRAHNTYCAEQDFGEDLIRRYRRADARERAPPTVVR